MPSFHSQQPYELSQEAFKRYRNLKQKKHRDHDQLFLVEGYRLLQELQQANWPVQYLLHEKSAETLTHSFSWPTALLKKGGVSLLSEVPSPQALIAVARYKAPPPVDWMRWKKIVFLEHLSDPGNLGTLFRSAAAFKVDAVFLGPHCTDPFHPKSLRASMGGLFKIPFYSQTESSTLFTQLALNGFQLFGTSPRATQTLDTFRFPPKVALVFSNEAHGSQFESHLSQWLSIPLPGLESLNVAQAASIFFYRWSLDQP